MADEQFCEKNIVLRVSFGVRVSGSISFVVNIVFKIAGREIPLALCLHMP